ncbi:active breakpoint cluster region-related protein [Centruroides vittatus]|uniref:active breakpoint cluster region-related protein n=1 Tax=Centruroides vittatus TaxID=120091 RepID=UPI00350ED7D5
MSVFSDFQTAWAQRFPGCELPKAWEDDVRANLAKHQHRVSYLREELEKEEFYVEYLESLLADVDRVKKSYGSEASAVGEEKSSHSSDYNRRSLQNSCETLEGGFDGASCESLFDKHGGGVREGGEKENVPVTNPESQTSKKVGSSSSRTSTASSSSLHEGASADYDGEHSNPYVTVIEVGGGAGQSDAQGRGEKIRPSGSESSISETAVSCEEMSKHRPEERRSSGSYQKKKPPTPPPKKSRNLISTQLSRTELKLNKSKVSGDLPIVGQLKNDSKQNEMEATKLPGSIEKLDSNSFRPPLPPKHEISQELLDCLHSPLQETENFEFDNGNVPNNNQEGNDKTSLQLDYFNDNQTIYDTVAPDEVVQTDLPENTYRLSQNLSNNNTIDNVESEGDYVVFSECAFIPQKSISHDIPVSKSVTSSDSNKGLDSPDYATYMNIDYFLKKKEKFSITSHGESFTVDSDEDDHDDALLVHSFSSDQELGDSGTTNEDVKGLESNPSTVTDDVFDVDSGVYSSSVESTSCLYASGSSTPPNNQKSNEDELEPNKEELDRQNMHKCIIRNIYESETIYVECLTVLLQYMKALKATIGTSQPLLSLEDFNTVFFRIPELHNIHLSFLQGLKAYTESQDGKHAVGEHFKILASKLGVYAAFLQNYSKAIETVKKCSVENAKFAEIIKSIKLKYMKGQATTLEDLLHKPVARVQKNALVLHDLLRYTPQSCPDQKTLKLALKMTQCFLNDLNFTATDNMFPVPDRAQRHLVKNSFIVELSEGHRKLRHLFLFNDVVVCAKYKPSARQKFTFEIKWYIPLVEVVLPSHESDQETAQENSPFDILMLKSRASNVRDQILKEERIHQGKDKQKVAGRNLDKQKKKLAELEAQLVLASPNLIFRISQKNSKTYTFFLSSEFERTQWIEAIGILQSSAPATTLPLSTYELQAWITSCRKHLGTNLGSFLLRSDKDEDLLVGDLYLVVHCLHGLSRPSDIYLCFEVDSYGHFFNKAKTKICRNSPDVCFNQDFVIELEGSQTLRILCYENHPTQGAILRGKAALELTHLWLNDKMQEKSISLQEFMLTISLKFVSAETILQRIPSSKTVGLFGVKIEQVCKKEKSSVPFIITSCIREVERRGMNEIGIYRVSGSASDVQKLKKTFETNVYEAEQLLKEVDIHTVTGLLKLYLRELPEALFTDHLYPKFFSAFTFHDQDEKRKQLLALFETLPQVNQAIILHLLDHLVRVNHHEANNKMSLHNLATVFGPTVLRQGSNSSNSNSTDLLTAGTVDVMAQAGILYFFLKRRASGLPVKTEPESQTVIL